MVKILLAAGALLLASSLFAQLTSTPSGGNKKASVAERIGITDVTIQYSRPGVKGREGKIWGNLVYNGFSDQGFGPTKAAPWRAGANENTTISFSTPVKVESKELPAGTYGLFIAYDSLEPMVIFSRNSTSWGSFYYNEQEDALRVKVAPQKFPETVEWLKYEFTDETDTSAVVRLEWEKRSIPFRVEIDLVSTQLESFRRELRSDKGFGWNAWNQAAQWCLQHKVNYAQALQWADSSTSANFGGSNQFPALATKAQLLAATGKTDEALVLMQKALPYGAPFEVHQYARALIAQHKPKEALDVFKWNAQKNPKQFTSYIGLARGFSANGDYKNALKNALLAQPLAPDPLNKAGVDAMIVKLKEGKDIN